jgi:hypothetical protein
MGTLLRRTRCGVARAHRDSCALCRWVVRALPHVGGVNANCDHPFSMTNITNTLLAQVNQSIAADESRLVDLDRLVETAWREDRPAITAQRTLDLVRRSLASQHQFRQLLEGRRARRAAEDALIPEAALD